MEFKDKSVVVTGGGRGIGRAISLAFAREGAFLLIGYNSDEKAALETARAARNAGGKARGRGQDRQTGEEPG